MLKHPQFSIDRYDWENRIIQTPRLVIRAFRPEDGDDAFAYLSNPEIYRYEPGEAVDTLQAQELVCQMASSTEFWAIELKSEHKVIGQVYFARTEPYDLMTWELGYRLNPAYQRLGYASEGAAALVWAGFSAAGIHRVIAHCNPDNTASWKVLEKLGFRREGLLIKNIFFRRNELGEPIWTDTYVYAILAEEIHLRS